MLNVLARNWWIWAVRGIAALLFGFLAIAMPGITLAVLVLFFGAYILVDGLFAVIAAFRHRAEDERWWVLLLEGLVGIAAGVFTFVYPGLTELALLYLIAAWAVVTGVLEFVAAVRLRRVVQGEWMLALGGILSILFGIFVLIFPGAGALGIVWLLGAYAVLFGIMLLALAFRLRRLNRHTDQWARQNT